MDAAIVDADVYTDFKGLASLRARASKGNDEATLREVAGQFEALFIQMMLKSMRDASLGEGLMDNEHTRTYQSMFDKQIAIDLSKRQGLGLADMMVRQLGRAGVTQGGAEDGVQAPSGTLSLPVVRSPVAAEGAGEAQLRPESTAADWKPESPEAFVRELWPHAQKAARRLGTRPELLLAQAALETGWGQHMIRGSDGRNSLNLFGIKADAAWKGDRVASDTVEFRDGLMRRERAWFRSYDSLGESFADYAAFLESNPRYREALKAGGDAPAFARALAEAGYATDPDYAGKIESIMNSSRLKSILPSSGAEG